MIDLKTNPFLSTINLAARQEKGKYFLNEWVVFRNRGNA